MTTRFTEIMGQEPATWKPAPPTAERIAATGAALGPGERTLTNEQQWAWFGGVVFDKPVSWHSGVFRSGDLRLTPRQVLERAKK